MPREDRMIIFNYEELFDAFRNLCESKEMPFLLEGRITEIKHPSGDNARYVFDVEDESGSSSKTEEYSRDLIAAALMMRCRAHKIPLPKTAKKSVLFDNNAQEITLRVRVDPI